ncbi:MAG: AI-2E family transporter [Longicatena sp.]|nr:AI-2E family transporter [Longicatena sp.]
MIFEKDKKIQNLNMRQVLAIITYTIVLIWFMLHLDDVWNVLQQVFSLLSPFIIGLVLAFLFQQPLQFFLKKLPDRIGNMKTVCAVLLSLFTIVGALTFIGWIVIPLLIENATMLAEAFPGYIESAIRLFDDLMSRNIIPSDIVQQIEVYIHELETILVDVLKNGLPKVIDIASSLASSVANVVMGIVIAIYLTISKTKLLQQLDRFVYAFCSQKVYQNLKKVGTLTNKTFSSFVSGQLLESLIIGILCYIGCLILRFPYAPIISVIIGCTNIIPVFGAIMGVVIGALLIALVDPFQGVIFIIFGILLQQLESNLIYPRVVGNTVGLSGLWVLMSISIGGGLFGALGMLLGLPIFSIVYTLLKEEMHRRLKKKGEVHYDLCVITSEDNGNPSNE